MLALVLLLGTVPALAGYRDVLRDAVDGRIDDCYTRAEFREALQRARADQRLYDTDIDVIKEAQVSNVKIAGRPCGTGRTVPSAAVGVGGSGAWPVWLAAAGLVGLAGAGGGLLARRGRR